MSKVIDDLVVLGRAAPEPISDGRETVCLGGYSETEGWIRIYPTKRRMTELRRWNIVSVPVESDDSHDSRPESYKISGSREDWDNLHSKVKKEGRLEKRERIKLADKLASDCPAALNNERVSLGMVNPDRILSTYLQATEGPGPQVDLEMNPRKGKDDYPYKLYIKYRCEGCVQKTPHDQHTIEWGVHKYWDKYEEYEGVIDALNLNNNDVKKYFFVGNLNNHRSAYIIISILRFKKEEMLHSGVLPDKKEQELRDDVRSNEQVPLTEY
jgi:hypothetical protein